MTTRKIGFLVMLGALLLGGCGFLYENGETTGAWVYREDGARRRCVSAPFRLGLFRDNKRQALRVLRACIAACQNHGFFARIYPPELNEFDDAVDLEDARGMLPDECKDS